MNETLLGQAFISLISKSKRIRMKRIKIGIVGIGFISDWHFQGFKENQDAEIAGMCRDYYGTEKEIQNQKLRLNNKCKEWGIKAYESFEDLVQDKEIDALIIGSINPLHYEQIIRALDLGKHLLVEKPVVTSFNHLDEIISKSNSKGCILFPAHNFVYHSKIIEAKEKIQSGQLGKIVYTSFISTHTISNQHASGWRKKLSLSSGGALMDSGHHLVYQSLYLMGMPVKVQAFTANLVLNQMEGEDIAQLNLTYQNGALGTIMQSWTSGHGRFIDGIKIVGTDGDIAVTEVDYAATFQAQASAFTEAIKKGTPPLSHLEDVRKTLRIIHAAYESSKNETVITL